MIKNDLKSLQKCQVEILDAFDAICKKHDLKYWLDFGTLLGAVRHQSFIPWDDDLDVGMPAEDFHKFIAVASSELPDNIVLQLGEHGTPTKLRDTNSLFIEYGADFSLPTPKGVYIDVFQYIDFPDLSKKTIRFFYNKIQKPDEQLKYMKHYLSFKSVLQFFYFHFEKIIFSPIWKLVMFLTKNRKQKYANPLENNGYFITQSKSDIFPLSEAVIDGKQYPCPGNSDSYLKTIYSDYWKLPPEEKRSGHAYMYFMNLNDR